MDEMSGTRLYNHAYYRSSTFDYVDLINGVSWHYFKETVGKTNSQFTDSVNFMFCNKENYTYIGDHCEYFQCNQHKLKHPYHNKF